MTWLIVWLSLILSVGFCAYNEYQSKHFALSPSWLWLGKIYLVSFFCTTCWLPAIYFNPKLIVVGVIWSLLGTLATVIIGVWIFHEPVNFIKGVGLLCAFISIILLSI